jgi:CRP-like cAMP-binding protein
VHNSRDIGRIDVILVFLRLVTLEALFGGVGHLRLFRISTLPELKTPAAGRCMFLRVLHHDSQRLSGAFHVRTVGDREFVQVGREYSLVGKRPALLERGRGAVESASIGRSGVIGASAGLGARSAFARAIVQLPGTAAWLSAAHFYAAASQSQAIRDLIVHYNDLLLAQTQQSVACNALHVLETRLCRWLLQTHDCIDSDAIPLTQELLGQMLGVRRTTVTIAARLLQSAGLIRYRRGVIQILDRKGLEEISCECYAAVRKNADKVFSAPQLPR